MTQTSNRFFDEIGRLMNDAAGAAQGVKREVDTVMRNQAERILRDLDVVKREEFEAVKDMARLAREENEALKARIAALEAKLGGVAGFVKIEHSAASWPGLTRPSIFFEKPPFLMDARVKPGHDERGSHFPCHFRTLGIKARHVRSPRTPGGLLRRTQ